MKTFERFRLIPKRWSITNQLYSPSGLIYFFPCVGSRKPLAKGLLSIFKFLIYNDALKIEEKRLSVEDLLDHFDRQ